MGGRSGGGARSAGGGGGGSLSSEQRQALDVAIGGYAFNPLNPRGIKDERIRTELTDAIKLYAKEVGFTDWYSIGLDNLPKGISGLKQGWTIKLSKSAYGGTYESAMKYFNSKIASGEPVVTSRPIAKTIVHELAHGTYQRLSPSGKSQVAATYKSFIGGSKRKGWGSYATKNVEEFYAEGIAKGLLGKSDSWTKAIRKAK